MGGINMTRKNVKVVISKQQSAKKRCISCGWPCWRSDVSYCWDCYKYQYFESK